MVRDKDYRMNLTPAPIICDYGTCDFCGAEGRTAIYSIQVDDGTTIEVEACEACLLEDDEAVAGRA